MSDLCSSGKCTPGKVQSCDDGNPCTADACNPGSGCASTPTTGACNDGSACTSQDTCSKGSCGGTNVVCNDNNPCTTDACNPSTGCAFANNTALCDDGDVCSVGDACLGGACTPGKAQSCDDGNPCTTDSCDKTLGCLQLANSLSCNDGSACTSGDKCSGGKCGGTAVVCNDNNACTDDVCDLIKGCVSTNNAAACSDGSACTSGDVCKSGICGGTTIGCDDGNPCTTDACNPSSGCTHAAQNGTTCGGNGTCLSGTCSPGSSVNPGASCKAIKAALPTAATGSYWIDPDGTAGTGAAYQVNCEMVSWGGGWMKIDNAGANALLYMTQPNLNQGKCQMTALEWRSWDQFDGAPGTEHLCIGLQKVTTNWPTYQEIRIEQVVLTGYCSTGGSFDLGTNCYNVNNQGDFCYGPATQLIAPNTVAMSLTNGTKSPVFTRQVTLATPARDFQVRSRERGAQAEGVIWNTGAVYLR